MFIRGTNVTFCVEACGSVTPLPKVKQVLEPKKELRPISLTSSLWKIAYIKPAWEDVVDPNRFGNTSGSSTVLALIGMVHKWLEATDGNSATVRVFFLTTAKLLIFVVQIL